jgi:acetolactate synthase-1/2/3 large subunit
VYQNADLLICIGTRLDTKATGQIEHWAREARIVMVDIDPREMEKFERLGRRIDVPIACDAGRFLKEMSATWPSRNPAWQAWLRRCIDWKHKYTAPPAHKWSGTDPYELMQEIAQCTTPEDILVSDTGTALGYLMQGYPFKGERFLHAFNMTPMGYGLPAAIGSTLATGKRTVLLTGDGSILMSLAEMATVARHNLPIKIILLDNGGHAMCRQTERQWLGGKYVGTDVASGLGMPQDWYQVARGFGFEEVTLNTMFSTKGPEFCVVNIDPDAGLIPQAKYGQPLEDADPQLPREEFRANMIVKPV